MMKEAMKEIMKGLMREVIQVDEVSERVGKHGNDQCDKYISDN